MSDAAALYQALIVEHGQHPRREGALAGATHQAKLNNPLCGDRVTVYLRVEEGRLRAVGFEAKGCMIAKASASIMSELLEGRTVEEARALARTLHALARDPTPPPDAGPLEPLRAVREFPARVACAQLAWKALESALGAAQGQ